VIDDGVHGFEDVRHGEILTTDEHG
jgi:hypothetical protein